MMKKKKARLMLITAFVASTILVAVVEIGMSITDARMERELSAINPTLASK